MSYLNPLNLLNPLRSLRFSLNAIDHKGPDDKVGKDDPTAAEEFGEGKVERHEAQGKQ